MISKKEEILQNLELALKEINVLNSYDGTTNYENTVGYIDRQYINIQEDDIKTKPNNWVIINNEGESFDPIVGGSFENTLHVQIVGFIQASKDRPNLDTNMNSLQRDIFLAMMKDVTLGGKCDYIMPVNIETVDELMYPYGGFVISFDIVYTFFKNNI